MAEAWHIARSTRTCAGSGEAIPVGTAFFSALVESAESFERKDYSPAAWPEADKTDFFSYWKNKGSEAKEEKKQTVDYDRLLSFFDSLESAGAEEPQKQLFRYVLALILVRRRKLRLEATGKTETGDGDRLLLYDRRTEKTLEITAPEATRAQLAEVQTKLNALFECDVSP